MIENTIDNRLRYIPDNNTKVTIVFSDGETNDGIRAKDVDWSLKDLIGFYILPSDVTIEEDEAWGEIEKRMDVIGQNGNTGEHYDNVNHPEHYQSDSGIECIDAIQACLTDEEFRGYCKGNAIKYLWRERLKGGDESLQKAVWYLNRIVS